MDTIEKESKFLKAGTVLVPKPDWVEFYAKSGIYSYTVKESDERIHATIGNNWMIKVDNDEKLRSAITSN